MKYFKPILVVTLIFIFPAVSYLYLRSGFQYRKDALEELKEMKDLALEQKEFLLSKDSTFFDAEDKIVNLYLKMENEQDEKDLQFLGESMKNRSDLAITALYSNLNLASFSDTIYSKTIQRFPLSAQTAFFDSEERLILTKENKIRKTYGRSVDQFKKAYEHTVILLPVEKKDKITLIREDEK